VASMIAPYSVKAWGKDGENLSLLRWSQTGVGSIYSVENFAIASDFWP